MKSVKEEYDRGFVAFFINRPTLVNAFLILVFMGGLFALSQISRNQFPNVDMKRLSVTTTYPGASPQDVALKVTKIVEDAIKTVSGVKRYYSTSSSGSSVILIDIMTDDPNPEKIKSDLRNEINIVDKKLPDTATKPDVEDIDPTVLPVVEYMVTSNYLSEQQLHRAALDGENQLRSLPGVKEVLKLGFRDREYQVFADIRKMDQKEITLSDINTAIANYNVRAGGGDVQETNHNRSIVTESLFNNIKDVAGVTIRENFQGENVKISDIGSVNANFAPASRYVRAERSNGQLIEVLKEGNVDILGTVDESDKVVQEQLIPYYKEKYGDQINVIKTYDMTIDIKDLLSISWDNAWQGFLLVFIILLIFLDSSTAFWSAFNIPVSILMTFVVMKYYYDLELDLITLFGMITVLGIVVDQGIVVAENIYQKVEKGLSPKEATIRGTNEIAKAIGAAVSTTIMAFAPLLAMGDIMGEFIRPLPMVIIIALICSTIEVFVSLPSHILHGTEKRIHKLEKKGKPLHLNEGGSMGWFGVGYKGILRFALKYRYLTILFFLFMLMMSFKAAKHLKFNLFSDEQGTEMQITLVLDPSKTLDQSLFAAKHVENQIVANSPYGKELRSITTEVGIRKDDPTNPMPEEHNTVYMDVLFIPSSERDRGVVPITETLRERLKKDPFMKTHFTNYTVNVRASGPPSDADFQWRISSNNEVLLKKVTDEMSVFMAKQKGAYGIDNTAARMETQLGLYLKYDQMYRLGVNPDTVSNTVQYAYAGSRQTNYIPSIDDPYYVRLSLLEPYQRSVKELYNLLIPASRRQVSLSQVADIKEELVPNSYYHYDGRLANTVGGFMDKTKNAPIAVDRAIVKDFLPKYENVPNLWISQSGEGENTASAFSGTKKAAILGLVGIFLILITTLNSIWQSIFLMLVIPFSLIGVLYGFLFHNEALGFFAMIGVLGLAGVVVNHAVVLVDLINRRMTEEEIDFDNTHVYQDFLIEASETRLRPIILTTLCTVVGLIPAIYGLGGSNDFLKPLSIALADGLLIGMLVTLLLLPSFYHVDRDVKKLVRYVKSLFSGKKS